MEISQLEAFFHVAELGSFTRAATVLDTTQPALSRLVRQLETELRQHLLVRNGRGVTVTEAGKVLLGHAKSIVQQIERARQDLDELRGKPGGHFTIGLLPTVARLTASLLVQEFHRAFPAATISIVEGLSSNLSEWLTIGRLDAAVLYDTSSTPLIDKRRLIEQALYLIGPPAPDASEPRAVPFAQVGNYRLITPSRMHGVRQVIESLAAESGIRLTITLEVDAIDSILDLVHEGFGYAVQPLNPVLGDRQRRKFAIHPFTEPTPMMQLVLATSRRHPLSKLAGKALEMVERHVLERCTPSYTN